MESYKSNSTDGFIFTKSYLIIIVLGIVFCLVSLFVKNENFNIILISIGTTTLTLGISLPIAVFQQNKHNSRHFKIIKACDESGISNIFISRKKDSTELKQAIENAAYLCDNEIRLLGVAFPDLINPNSSHTQSVEEKLSNPNTKLKILLLNPESDSAKRRQIIETNNTTIVDIKYTLEKNIQAYIIQRKNNLSPNVYEGLINQKGSSDFIKLMRAALGIEIHLYENDPIMQQLDFEKCMFVEQYHFGRPDQHVPPFGCIGKNVPVIQFKNNCIAFDFYKDHFDYLWNHSIDRTDDLITISWNLDNKKI